MKTIKNMALSIASLCILSPISLNLYATQSAKEITILESGGTSGESIEKAYVAPLTEKTGIRVIRESPTSLGKLQAMVQSKNITNALVELGSTNFIMARETGLIEPLDWDIINPEPMFPEARMKDGFGYQYFSTIMAWPKENKPLQSWKDFWDTENFPGKRALPDYPAYTLPLALLADGVAVDELYPLDIDRAFASLNKLKDHVSVWWQAGAQAPQLLEDNEVDYSAAWSGRIVNNPKLDYTYNQGLLQVSYFVVPKGTKPEDKKAAMLLLHEMSKAENQKTAIEIIPYTGASPDIDQYISADKSHQYPTSSENKTKQSVADPLWTAENAKKIEMKWQEFKLGL